MAVVGVGGWEEPTGSIGQRWPSLGWYSLEIGGRGGQENRAGFRRKYRGSMKPTYNIALISLELEVCKGMCEAYSDRTHVSDFTHFLHEGRRRS